MLNKKNLKNIILDPSRINAYNKFLISMDKNTYNFKPILNNSDINSKIIQPSILKTNDNCIIDGCIIDDLIKKKEIDELVEHIINCFSLNKFESVYSGQSPSDIYLDKPTDPNIYIEKNKLPYTTHNLENKINIDVEINDISDILKLIETYNIDSNIQYNINMKALHNIKEPLEELNNMIGMKELKINIIDQILYFIQDLHKNKNNSGDFMHTVIYGPPGTGKTEIAQIMGKIYSKIGILNKGSFKKVTRSDLIAGYLGQTALKTTEVIKEALGGVLFIDEAYALGNIEKKDNFSKECIDTLCEALSNNKDNLMVIIAGYESELKDCFFNYNQGLDSRFTWRFKIDEYTSENLYYIFLKKVKEINWFYTEDDKITISWFKKNMEYFKCFGRDVETLLAKTKISHSRRVFCKPENEKKHILLKDLEKGFEMYISNSDIKHKKEKDNLTKYLSNTMYC